MRILLWLCLAACSRSVVEHDLAEVPAYRVASDTVTEGPFTNRLVSASSPYLLQHAHNPVDWYAWGDEAFAEAERRDVPIFLSIGYAACHWCHVMEHESFEDPVLAAYLNANFVPIKVDREERPDVDSVYMDAVHALNNGHGGWPASIWLTPDGKPFLAGTYFPPVAARGRPGFRDVLEQVTTVWAERRTDITTDAERMAASLQASAALAAGEVPEAALGPAVGAMVASWDAETKGWGSKKFPMTPRLEAMLAHGAQTGDLAALGAVRETLWAMDRGGIHDQISGGFHRYTVDTNWQIPHFEKMMYDNGQLLGLYASASVVLDEPRFAEVARATADWMLREMTDGNGAFYSSQDADTDGEEGTTYTWTPAEVRAVLGDDAEAVITALSISERGNFEGTNVLTRPSAAPPEASLLTQLRDVRDARPQPATDHKLVVSYNALAIGGLARAGRLLDAPEYTQAASRAADVLLARLAPGGTFVERFPRTLAPDSPDGVLDDYAFTAVAFVELFEATGDVAWLDRAGVVVSSMDSRFWNEEDGAWYVTADLDLLVRQTVISDGPEPSGYARAAQAHLLLHAYGSDVADPAKVERALAVASRWFERAPNGVPTLARAHALSVAPARTFVVTGDSDAAVAALAAPWSDEWRPDGVLAALGPDQRPHQDRYTALADKTPGETGARAFLCLDGVCERPVSTPEDVRAMLAPGDTP